MTDPKQSWLKKRMKAALRESGESDSDWFSDPLEAVAREFAERALYEFCDIIDASGTQRGELAEALAAAERDE